MTKIVMTLLVRDEADIVDHTIRHHLELGVDFVIATDNLSKDGTDEKLRDWERAGVLQYLYEPSDDYRQSEWVTRMARLAADMNADWVVNGDADEFIWPLEGSLRDCLGAVGEEHGLLEVQRFNFRPRPDVGSSWPDTMVYREVRSMNANGRPLLPKVIHRASDKVSVRQGNHAVDGVAFSRVADHPLIMFHFPERSYEQFAHKIEVGGKAYERNPNSKVGLTWRNLYDELKAGRLEDYWSSRLLTDDAVPQEIASGKIVLDRRLQRSLGSGGVA